MTSILGTWTIRTATEGAAFELYAKVTMTEGEDGNVIVVVTDSARAGEYVGWYDAGKTKVIVHPLKEKQHWEFVVSEILGDPLWDLRRMYGFSWESAMTQPDPMGVWGADPQGH